MQRLSCRSGTTQDTYKELRPSERLKRLQEFAKSMDVDHTMNPNVYFHSGLQCVQEADKLLKEGDYENSYVFYNKFLTVNSRMKFHPQFMYVPLDIKSAANYKLIGAKKNVKILEEKILAIYREHYSSYKKESSKKLTKSSYKKSLESLRKSQTSACDLRSYDRRSCGSLRTVVIPNQLTTIFQVITQRIYRKKDTALGILAGEHKKNEYIITHLLVPDHSGSYEFNLDEENCIAYIKDHNLIKLGWIHIHVSSAYMSTVDLHLHYIYQKEFPESICIICAPRVTEVKIFNLLDYGMGYIGNCDKVDCHVHVHQPDKALYSTAKHVKIVYDAELEVIDFRQKIDSNIAELSETRNSVDDRESIPSEGSQDPAAKLSKLQS